MRKLHPFFKVIVIVFFIMLSILIASDIYHMLKTNQPISYNITNLMKLAFAGILGTIAGYLAKE